MPEEIIEVVQTSENVFILPESIHKSRLPLSVEDMEELAPWFNFTLISA